MSRNSTRPGCKNASLPSKDKHRNDPNWIGPSVSTANPRSTACGSRTTRATSVKPSSSSTRTSQEKSAAPSVTKSSGDSGQNQQVNVQVHLNLAQLMPQAAQAISGQQANQAQYLPPSQPARLPSVQPQYFPANQPQRQPPVQSQPLPPLPGPPPNQIRSLRHPQLYNQFGESNGFHQSQHAGGHWNATAVYAINHAHNNVNNQTMQNQLGLPGRGFRTGQSGWSSAGNMFGMSSHLHFSWSYRTLRGLRVFSMVEAKELMQASMQQATDFRARGNVWGPITDQMLSTGRLAAVPMSQPWLTCNQVHLSGLAVIGGHHFWRRHDEDLAVPFIFRLYSISPDGTLTFFCINSFVLEECGGTLEDAGVPVDDACFWSTRRNGEERAYFQPNHMFNAFG
ncbi:MAG: hypothetical protein M1828_001423 [Chrysothrix sp. TS-e1954]|nr:MAG: hypothetical protein M1828_001423 [Chrysothrix sp. TS-e1954]